LDAKDASQSTNESAVKAIVGLMLSMAALGAGMATLAGYFDTVDWLPSLFSWGRFQYLEILVVCCAGFAVMRDWKFAVTCAVLALLNVIAVSPYFVPAATASQGGDSLKICQFNVNVSNIDYARFDEYIRKHDPDIILLQELSNGWEAHMAAKLPEYKYRSFETKETPFGIGTFSRIPFSHTEIRNSSTEMDAPYVISTLYLRGKNVKVINLHTYPMIGMPALKRQSEQFANIIAEAEAPHDGPLIVAGDFNSPLWSSSMQALQNRARVRSAALGMGWQPTWPRKFERFFVGEAGPGIDSPLLMLSIDHCMINDKLAVRDFVVHEDLLSDHNPLFIELIVH
jgi:endonuclease/exonuclease/phosphatase (EEP) superfamily protein YafD